MEFVDFLEELEAIVYSGTAVDLVYYIDELIDTEGADEIYDFFKTEQTGNIDNAVNDSLAEAAQVVGTGQNAQQGETS